MRAFDDAPAVGGRQSCDARHVLLRLLDSRRPLFAGIVVDQHQGRNDRYQYNQNKTST
jgi:hypothetical protein